LGESGEHGRTTWNSGSVPDRDSGLSMSNGSFTGLLHVISWILPAVIGLFVKTEDLLSSIVVKPLGIAVFLLGMTIFVWGVAYLKKAFLGYVEPKSDTLITSGPYRFVRHPIYLAMITSAIGLAIGLRSLWAVLAVLLLLVPTGIYRAHLEEKALSLKFGTDWDKYSKRTRFMFPLIY
jgi:protein-S-isoprenylcysteine O-methyltransferase Ste14